METPSGTGSTKPNGGKDGLAHRQRPGRASDEQAGRAPASAVPAQGSARTGRPEGGMPARMDKREGALLRLASSEIKLAAIYQNEGLVAARGREVGLLRSVLRESIILNLHIFLQARRDLMSDPRYECLDELLKPLIGPILEVEAPITKLRDRYIAHIQERGRPFKVRIQDIIDRHMLDMHYEYWLSLARSAVSYAMFVQANYAGAMTEAERKYDETLPLPFRYGHGDPERYRKAYIDALNKAAGRLRSHGSRAMPREARPPIEWRRQN